MRLRWVGFVLGSVAVLPLACKKDEQPPPQQPVHYQQPYPAQPAAPAATVPTAAQSTPAQPQVAQPAPAPGTPAAPAAAGGMSQPSPMALACQSDAQCLTHRCNTQFGKCAWPCQSANDCVTGNQCMAGACVPKVQ